MSVGSALKAIGHGLKVVATKIADGFVKLFGSDAAKAFAEASAELLRSAVGQIVVKIVEDLQDASLDSNAKREQAVIDVLKLAAGQSIQVAESEVRMLIELAVQFVKGKLAVNVDSPIASGS